MNMWCEWPLRSAMLMQTPINMLLLIYPKCYIYVSVNWASIVSGNGVAPVDLMLTSEWKFDKTVAYISQMKDSICSGHRKMPMYSLTPHCPFGQKKRGIFSLYAVCRTLISLKSLYSIISWCLWFKCRETQIAEWLTSDHLMQVRLKPWIRELLWDYRQIITGGIY